MCEPITIGILTAVSMGVSAVGQYQQQQAAVARSNAIAQQQYQQQLQIASYTDQMKGRTFEAQLNANAAAKNAYYAQLSTNQAEANRALTAEQNKLQEQERTAAFQGQKAVASAIRASGSILSTGKMGQSFLLQAMDAQRELGIEMAQIDATLYDAKRASGLAQEGIMLDLTSANYAAWNNLPANPLSPEATFTPIAPIMQEGPSGLALAGGLLGAGLGGVTAGYQADAAIKASQKP